MKQHITKKQWDELNDKQKEVLSEWIRVQTNNASLGIEFRGTLSMTIGQMIEFLGDDLETIDGVLHNTWMVFIRMNPDVFEDKELCDSLWEAVKYELKNNGK